MTTYISVKSFGKGFITHADQEQDGLKFACLAGDITQVDGDETKIDAWIERVKGVKEVKTDALKKVKDAEKTGKQNRIKELRKEIKEIESSLLAL